MNCKYSLFHKQSILAQIEIAHCRTLTIKRLCNHEIPNTTSKWVCVINFRPNPYKNNHDSQQENKKQCIDPYVCTNQGIVKATVFYGLQDLKFKISEGSDQN